ncbi:MAG: ATP-binding protein [Cyanobacteria bacterium P01_D01_bin.14]
MLGSPLKQRPLRAVLIVPFAIQTALISSLIGYITFRNGQNTVEDLARQLETEVSKRVEQDLDRHLALPHQINQINAGLIEEGLLDIQDLESAGSYFWDQAQLFDKTGYIGYALPTGAEAGAGRWIEGEDVVIFHGYAEGEDKSYATDEQGNRAEVVETLDYDPLVGSWYIDAVRAEKAIWSGIVVTPGFEGYISATAAQPVYDESEELIAVLLVDYLLSDINDFLKSIDISPNGQVFIMQRDGLLVGNSGEAPSYIVEGEETRQLPASASSNRTIELTARYLQDQFPDFESIKNIQQLEFQADGDTYFVRLTPWQDEFGLDWLVVSTVPASDFTSQLQDNARNTALLSIGGLLAAIAIGTITSRWVTRPIKELMNASRLLAEGKLDGQVEVHGIKEVETLGTAFNQMAQQLKQSFQDLQNSNDELEQRVEERTADLQQTLVELKQTQARLLHQEKMSSLGQLVAGVAHEINNPINFINGNISPARNYAQDLIELVQLYQETCPEPPAEVCDRIEEIDLAFIEKDLPELFNSMHVGSERIREIVKSLRNFSRLDEAELKEADLHEGIESTLMILQNQIKGKPNQTDIKIVKDYGDLPKISCYAGQLNQVFMNLLSNAIDAFDAARTATDTPTIQIQTRVTDDHQVVIHISDNGPGIPAAVKDKIFDPFFTTKPVGQGTGLGLSISYQIVTEQHGGALECESVVGEGTRFTVRLPIQMTCQTQPMFAEPESEPRSLVLT